MFDYFGSLYANYYFTKVHGFSSTEEKNIHR